MGTLVLTYAVGGGMVMAYAVWLAIGKRRVCRRLQKLET
jgi:hypothetical protein